MLRFALVSYFALFFFVKVLWKAYIDFEISQDEYQKTRDLYERLLERTQHVKVSFRAGTILV